MAEKALARYTNDPNYQFLHDQISALFAELLSSDIKCLKSEKYGKVSLAAKWCPSLDSSYDQSTLICESIAKKVFPRDSDPEYEGIVESHYAFKVRAGIAHSWKEECTHMLVDESMPVKEDLFDAIVAQNLLFLKAG
ncbi:hypothetical protein IFM89_024107 [Coptis chinensis]|uniref:DUF2828 domain-containing protein n=1 Tax=Coptis chinensis TaxID=261450 RepID=A0A835LJM6_9MAGN|nr:hypothetical protein IFM89_024107 [Coptis chinensis]